MLFGQDALRLIFGLKLRQHRQKKGCSLKELSSATGLSASYLNEIEKGKKYPKNDKIMLLAGALDVAYDDLISVKLQEDFGFLTQILEKNYLQNLPFDLFGIPVQELIELVTSDPAKFKLLSATLIELARTFNLRVEDFLFAALKAHIELKNNYFEDIELKAREFAHRYFELAQSDISILTDYLQKNYNYQLIEVDFNQYDYLSGLKHVIRPGKRNKFFINKNLDQREKNFIYLKEIGHNYLQQNERTTTSVWHHLDSYAQLFNNFRANYFASAFFIPRDDFISRLNEFFSHPQWSSERFLKLIESYRGTWDSFFHRMVQILPTYFRMNQVFFLRFNHNTLTNGFEITSEIQLMEKGRPYQVRSELEYHCRRWITLDLLDQLGGDPQGGARPLLSVQRSRFFNDEREYLCFSMAKREGHIPYMKTSLTVGLLITPTLQERIRFLTDPTIEQREVGITCQRCGIMNCTRRMAPPILHEKELEEQQKNQSIERMLREQGQ